MLGKICIVFEKREHLLFKEHKCIVQPYGSVEHVCKEVENFLFSLDYKEKGP